jgi:archaellum component FlaF (FlaF/FlaG flagellin family)
MVKQIIIQKLTSMKKLTYIITVLLAAVALYRCAEDPMDRRISSADFFVTFETHNAVNKTLSITEGDTVVVTVTIGATLGSAVTVDFDVTPPSSVTVPASAAYELLKMDNTPLTAKTLTFPQGTGAQSFKFVATDNNDIDGSRTFTLKLTGVSNNYRVGVNAAGEGATLPVAVKDDEVVILMSDLAGEWEVRDQLYYSSAWHPVVTYKIAIDSIIGNPSQIKIKGLAQNPDLVLTATVDLDKKTKTISIPAQKITPTWNPSYDTWFNDFNTMEAVNSIIDKADDGTLTIPVAATETTITYEIAAVTIGEPLEPGYLGTFRAARGTKFVKQP